MSLTLPRRLLVLRWSFSTGNKLSRPKCICNQRAVFVLVVSSKMRRRQAVANDWRSFDAMEEQFDFGVKVGKSDTTANQMAVRLFDYFNFFVIARK